MELAICLPAFAQVRAEESHRSELVSQLRLGEPVCILKEGPEWSLIKTEHQYEGFVRTAQLHPVEADLYASFSGVAGKAATRLMGFPVSAGAFLWKEKTAPGIVPLAFEFAEESSQNFAGFLVETARDFLGVPYVWGGKTQWGLDCSGLVQLLINLSGYSFPRDAWQQAESGSTVDFQKNEINAEAGDLLFFKEDGKKIHHVAVSLGGAKFIHASEWVRINSFSDVDPDFAEDRFNTLCLIKRIRPADLQTMRASIENMMLS